MIVDNVKNSTMYHRVIGEIMMLKEFALFVPDSTPPGDYVKKYTTNVRKRHGKCHVQLICTFVGDKLIVIINAYKCFIVHWVDEGASSEYTSADSAVIRR